MRGGGGAWPLGDGGGSGGDGGGGSSSGGDAFLEGLQDVLRGKQLDKYSVAVGVHHHRPKRAAEVGVHLVRLGYRVRVRV